MIKLNWYRCERNELDIIPNESGLYVISTKQKTDGKYAVNYVGQSVNLRNRVNEHFGECEENEDLKRHLAKNYTTKISFSRCNEKYLDGIENYLYQKLKPNCNNIAPPGDETIECNLPNVRPY